MSGTLAHQGLIRLKSIIFIGRKFGTPEVELGIMLALMPAYRYGSHHLCDLSTAIDAFRRLGGPIVRNACNDPEGIKILSRESPSSLPVNFRGKSYSNYPLDSLPYVPQMIGVCRFGAGDEIHATAFVESVLWLSSKNPEVGRSRREVQVQEENTDFLEKCARLVSSPGEMKSGGAFQCWVA